MLRLLFWLVVLGLGWLLLNGQVPLPGVAEEEIVYATTPSVAGCGSSGCVLVYTLELANTGRSPQDSVRVRLRADALGTPLVPPTLRRTTDAVAVQKGSERAGVETYQLGRLAPEERVALVFALRAASREAAPRWEQLLVGIEPALGAARPGDPAAVTPVRVLHATGRVLQRAIATLAGTR